MRKARRFAALCAAGIVMSLLVPTGQAQAATNYQVVVGAGLGKDCAPDFSSGNCFGESMRFLPGRLTVHKGDSLTFIGGFHTATMLPVNTDAQDWIDKNSSSLGQPYFLLQPNSDDAENPVKFRPDVFFPDAGCGSAAAPCDYDGTSVVDSDALFNYFPDNGPPGFTATVNAEPGSYFWVVCVVHPHMRMKVTVVDDATAATSPQDAQASVGATLQKDNDAALAYDTKLNKPTSHRDASGKKVWDAYAGYDSHWITLYKMYPKKLRIRKNESVRYHFDQLVYETHTATLPVNAGTRALAEQFAGVPSCDPDTDAGPGPNTPPNDPNTICSDPAQIEFTAPARAVLQQGDGVFSGNNDFENSGVGGVLAASPARGDAAWDVRFSKPSTKKGYKYFCLIHPDMVGRVVVR